MKHWGIAFAARVFPVAGDDISHEVPPTGISRSDNRRKPTPSPDKKYYYPRPDGGNAVQVSVSVFAPSGKTLSV